MKYTADEVMQYAAEEDVKFVRLAFCDIRGRQKNIAILPDELGRAFRYGIAIDASAIAGFGGEVHSDLFLHPDTSTLTFLPWLSEQGKVIRMFCHITYPDGTPFEADTRSILAKAVDCAHEQGCHTTTPAIWTLPPRTRAKTSAGRYVSPWSRWA